MMYTYVFSYTKGSQLSRYKLVSFVIATYNIMCHGSLDIQNKRKLESMLLLLFLFVYYIYNSIYLYTIQLI